MNSEFVRLLQRYGFAIFSTMLATVVRLGIQPSVGDRVPFGLFVLAVLLTAWVAGTGPAVLTLVAGIFAAAHWIIPPSGSWWVPHPADQIALFVFGIVGAAAVVLFHRSRVEASLLQERACENDALMARLKEADQRKDEFLALLAHELRNPLAPICAGLEVLDRVPPAAETDVEPRRIIRRQVDQLVRIVDDLLDVSRFLRGQLPLQVECVDLRDVVELARNTVQPLINEHQHEVTILQPPTPVPVVGDEVRLTQAVANLLTNAARYTPRNGRIRILLDVVESEAQLQVSDNGIGISHEAQDDIFELFSQGNPSPTRDHGGLGLGLAIVRQILELHSGTVTAQSDGPGRGSCFTVSLPLAMTEPAGGESCKSPVPALDDSPSSASTDLRILIVDDNQDAAQTLAMLLSYEGYSVQTANDGHSALNVFDPFKPDVVFLDIGMPGMDGYEVARRLRTREAGQRSKIIAVTGWGQATDRQRSAGVGIDHHLVKPVQLSHLLELIDESKPQLVAAGSGTEVT